MLQKLLTKIARELDSNDIPYIVIGGQAAILHGVVRATQDIDITLGIDTSEINRLKKIIFKLKLRYIKKSPDKFAKQMRVLPVYDPGSKIKVDFVFSFSPFEQNAIKRSVIRKINRTMVKFCSLEDLIIFKIVSGRAIDLFDVRNVILLNKGFDKKYIAKWLNLFEETTNEKYIERLSNILKSIK